MSAAVKACRARACPGRCSTGLATIRRDGFVSMTDAWPSGATRPVMRHQSTLITRPLRFTGAHAFVNADVAGAMRVEMLDREGKTIPGFESARSVPVTGNHTRQPVSWTGDAVARTSGQHHRPFQVRARSRPPVRILGQPVAAWREPRVCCGGRSGIPGSDGRVISRRAFIHGTAGVAVPAALDRGSTGRDALQRHHAGIAVAAAARRTPTSIRHDRPISPIGRRWCRSMSAGSSSWTTS